MNSKEPKKIRDKLNPGLYDRSYEQDPSSHESRWSNRTFRDLKTNAIIIPTPQYLMQQFPGWIVNGSYNPSSNIIENDRDKPNDEYKKTMKHELYHAEGKDEFTTRFLKRAQYLVSSLSVLISLHHSLIII